jgi:2-octaprenyl-6-methoxyphenol hydroxylase
MDSVDILIVGGGLTGSALLLALQNLGLKILLIDNKSPINSDAEFLDTRTLTLSEASIKILSNLKIWPKLLTAANPIEKIHVSQQGCFGITRFTSPTQAPLGFVANILYLTKILHQALPKDCVLFNSTLQSFDHTTQIATIKTSQQSMQIHTKLLVAADGTNSKLREIMNLAVKTKDYQQAALVTNILLNKDHQNCAYERFTNNGPIAALPMTNKRIGLVWCMATQHAEQLLTLDDAEFLKLAQQNFSYRLGKFADVGPRMLYPLKQYIMKEVIKWPCVFIGNAAQTLHPVAGQGFNLGLRDAVSLAECISNHGINDTMLAEYAKIRKHDKNIISNTTDKLIAIFANKFPGAASLRGFGLLTIDNCAPLQKLIARYAKGFGGHTPKLAYMDNYE